MSAIHQYKQVGYTTEKLYLTDEEYLRVLQSWVKYCHDIVLIGPDGAFYLSYRKPHKVEPGLWCIGGAVQPFTSILDSVVKNVLRETGIAFAKDRFVHVRTNRYWFSGLEGSNIPNDALCEIFTLTITAEELAAVRLDLEEYESSTPERFGKEEIETIPSAFVRSVFLDLWNDRNSKANT